jgi:hypothetical protein
MTGHSRDQIYPQATMTVLLGLTLAFCNATRVCAGPVEVQGSVGGKGIVLAGIVVGFPINQVFC